MMSAEEGRGTEDEEREVVPIDLPILPQVLEGYYPLGTALADDDLEAAHSALQGIMEGSGHEGPLADLLHTMLDAGSLEGMRRPHFETLSESLIEAMQAHPDVIEAEVLLMSCPMVYDNRPDPQARWLQSAEPLANPYFGAAMLQCGEVEGDVRQRAGGTGRGAKPEVGRPELGHQH
jgi:Cu(I)/Ag(I) efflux system membrane fusion protein